MTDVGTNYLAIMKRVREAESTPGYVTLVAVSKGQPIEKLRAAYDAGARDFGESYVEEWASKVDQLPDDVRWHFIGPLQTRTFKANVELFQRYAHIVHVVDRVKLARTLNDKLTRPIDVLIQVNVGEEPQKSGASNADLPALFESIRPFEQLNVRGLMTLPPWFDDPREVAPYFEKLRAHFENLKEIAGEGWTELSMGMSNDFEVAIAHGSTMVRVGSAIFGERNYDN